MGTKFKIDFSDVPSVLLRDVDGKKVLKLAVPSLSGRKVLDLKNGDVVEAVDEVMCLALSGFEFPKIPITLRPKKDKLAAGKNAEKLEYKQAYYDSSSVRGKKPFKKV
jgi:hypothetical protein